MDTTLALGCRVCVQNDLIYAGIHQHQSKRLEQHSNKLVNYYAIILLNF